LGTSRAKGANQPRRPRCRDCRQPARGTWHGYKVSFPKAGRWQEVYDNWVNPVVAGNGGAIEAIAEPMHAFAASAEIVIPANGVVIFVLGDD
jgi:1,4-alpha-glucan branching enzyme